MLQADEVGAIPWPDKRVDVIREAVAVYSDLGAIKLKLGSWQSQVRGTILSGSTDHLTPLVKLKSIRQGFEL